MGYYKWRKILTILMIISICFTLFSKISKVYAADESPDKGTSTTFNIAGENLMYYTNYITNQFDYYMIYACKEHYSQKYSFFIICSDTEFTAYYYDETGIPIGFNVGFETDPDAPKVYTYYCRSADSFTLNSIYWNNTYYNKDDITGSNWQVTYENLCGIYHHTNMNNWLDFLYLLDSNFVVKDTNDSSEVIMYPGNMRPPELANNLNNLADLSDNGLSVNSWDYSNINFYLLIYDMTLIGNDYEYVLNPAREILINKNSSYYQPALTSDPETNCVYFIPWSDTGLQFVKNGLYEIRFGIKKYYNERRRSEEEEEDGRGGNSDTPTPTEFVDPEDIYSDTDSSGTGMGGGFSSRPYYFNFIGENYTWTIDPNISQQRLDEINNSVILTDEQRRHYETTSLLEDILNGTTGLQEDALVKSGILKENNQDITANGFNGIFTRLYNAIDSTPRKVSLTIPFTNTPMEIDPNITYNGFGENNAILTFYQISIFAAVSLFILKDVAKIIQDIKSGDIATKTDTNIKANML